MLHKEMLWCGYADSPSPDEVFPHEDNAGPQALGESAPSPFLFAAP